MPSLETLAGQIRKLQAEVDRLGSVATRARLRNGVAVNGRKVGQMADGTADKDGINVRQHDSVKNAKFVTIDNDANLPNERKLTAGTNITLTDGGANGTLTVDAASGTGVAMVVGEIPSGTKDGANKTFTINFTPASVDSAAVYLGGVRLARVASSPSSVEFTLSGTTLTTGLAPNSTDAFFIDYLKSASITIVVGEIPSGTKDGANKTFTLAAPPLTVAELGLYMSGVRLARVASAPSSVEFTISGATITTGLAPSATDSLFADYLK